MVITAVSPNVVVDVVLWLKNERLGFYKGIHTIIVAVTAGNDVLSIFCFGVVLSAIISTGKVHRGTPSMFLFIFICIMHALSLLVILIILLSVCRTDYGETASRADWSGDWRRFWIRVRADCQHNIAVESCGRRNVIDNFPHRASIFDELIICYCCRNFQTVYASD